jgi:hypothetical protein
MNRLLDLLVLGGRTGVVSAPLLGGLRVGFSVSLRGGCFLLGIVGLDDRSIVGALAESEQRDPEADNGGDDSALGEARWDAKLEREAD